MNKIILTMIVSSVALLAGNSGCFEDYRDVKIKNLTNKIKVKEKELSVKKELLSCIKCANNATEMKICIRDSKK